MRDELRLMKQVKCGEYACLASCDCATLTRIFTNVAAMTPDMRTLLVDLICGSIRCGPDAATTPVGPGLPPPGNKMACLDRLVATVCSPSGQAAVTMLLLAIRGLKVVDLDEELGVWLLGLETILLQSQEFCKDPAGGKVDAFLAVVCGLWPIIKGGKGVFAASFGMLLGPVLMAMGALDALWSALDECCAATASSSITGPSPIPAPSGAPALPGTNPNAGTGGEPGTLTVQNVVTTVGQYGSAALDEMTRTALGNYGLVARSMYASGNGNHNNNDGTL